MALYNVGVCVVSSGFLDDRVKVMGGLLLLDGTV